MKYFSAFSGIGGFELGIGDKAECIGYSEIDKYAIQIYQKHYPLHKNYGDITKIKTKDLPDFDLFIGGFPCQAFSIAGNRQGFNDTRGTMFFEIARILADKRPRYFVLENVKGLLSHEAGKTFQTILGILSDLRYDLQWQVLNSKNFGVPQNRERVFIIGHLRGTSRPQVFPVRINDEVYNRSNETKEKIHNIAQTMTARQFTSWNGNYVALTERRTEEAKRLRRLGIVKDTRNLKKLEPREDGIANTVTTGDIKNSSLTNGSKIRRLTPTECERLQGFPDGWTKYGINEKEEIVVISDTQRYKVLGNAVTVNVVNWVIGQLVV